MLSATALRICWTLMPSVKYKIDENARLMWFCNSKKSKVSAHRFPRHVM